jgi:hypothetical protein
MRRELNSSTTICCCNDLLSLSSDSQTRIRICLEMLVGHDLDSFDNLMTEIRHLNFVDSQLYLVDHYLAKARVRSIMDTSHSSDNIIYLSIVIEVYDREWIDAFLTCNTDAEACSLQGDQAGLVSGVRGVERVEVGRWCKGQWWT